MSIGIAQDLRKRMQSHLFGHILPFWCGPALDLEQGGWMGWLSNDLKPDRSKPKGLIVNSRILWAFSAAYQAVPNTLYRGMAQRAFDYLITHFWDSAHGGAFWRLNDRGEVLDDSKKIYGQAFYIYAMVEFYRAFGLPMALQQAQQVVELIERSAHDNQNGGYVEVCARNWSEVAGARLSEKDMAEKKSMNNHLHVLEAYTSFHRAAGSALARERLKELIRLFFDKILDSRTGHLHHFFNETWQVRSDSYTFGHDIEASWLLCEAAEALGDISLIREARDMALRGARVVLDQALAPDGGLYYEGRGGVVVDRGRECWPQAEAMVGFLNAFELSGDITFLNEACRVWDFAEQKLADLVHGEWFWRVTENGRPDDSLPKVSEWKGPYHVTRACLESIRRLTKFDSNKCKSHDEERI